MNSTPDTAFDLFKWCTVVSQEISEDGNSLKVIYDCHVQIKILESELIFQVMTFSLFATVLSIVLRRCYVERYHIDNASDTEESREYQTLLPEPDGKPEEDLVITAV